MRWMIIAPGTLLKRCCEIDEKHYLLVVGCLAVFHLLDGKLTNFESDCFSPNLM